MTKREVRIQLLAELNLPARGVLWDLGAGTGSVGLEALRLRPQLQLLCIEQRSGGSSLIAANAARLGVQPAAVLEGDAMEELHHLPAALARPQPGANWWRWPQTPIPAGASDPVHGPQG